MKDFIGFLTLFLETKTSKRWSIIGPSLINVFDKILLKKSTDTRMKRSQTTG